ncbi:MAG: PKD domain-containing protein [Planctomycetota bacterium]|jgi:hypothetical protein
MVEKKKVCVGRYHHRINLIGILLTALAGWQTVNAALLTNVTVYHTSPGLADPSDVPRYEVFELTFTQPAGYGEQGNYLDIDIEVSFIGPVSDIQTVKGFYYDTLDGIPLWKVRFLTKEVGTYTYRYTFAHTPSGDKAYGTGTFECGPNDHPGKLMKNPTGWYRWKFENGQPFVPIGFNTCVYINDLEEMDGGDRYGAFLSKSRTDKYFKTHADAGFNMFRFSQDNCSPDLTDNTFAIASYNKDAMLHFDFLMQTAKAYNFRIFYGLLGFLLPSNPPGPTEEFLRFIEYNINRWGAYVDIWQIQNEKQAPNEWINEVATHIRDHDSYQHFITTSYERPDLPTIEISAPHWYDDESELVSDQITADKADAWKIWHKPVILGEQGNQSPDGVWGNWTPDSALRMRLRCWTAFFKEISFLFWETSHYTNGWHGGAANIYLGHWERQYIHVLQWFSNYVLRNDRTTINVSVSNSALMRAYGLTSSDGIALFIHHYADHTNTVTGGTVTVTVPAVGQGYWIDPATGQLITNVAVSAGSNILTIPDFVFDIAFFSTASPSIDTLPIQADGDLDDDGKADYGPQVMPFGIPPLTLTLEGSSSYDLDGGSVSYLWQFGDGTPDETTATVVHTYSAGNFFTTLTVTDDEGKKASHTMAVRVTGDPDPNTNNAPAFNKLRDVTVREGERVMITPYAVDRELSGSNYSSDQIIYNAIGMPSGATFGVKGANNTKQFWWVPTLSQNGIYPVEFHVQDDEGYAAPSQIATITVLDAIQSYSKGVADFDLDGDVDQEDFGHFQECLSGEGIHWGLECGDADMNLDGDVDLDDFTLFQGCMSGANMASAPDCIPIP